LTTVILLSSLAYFAFPLPGISRYYGSDQFVDVTINITSIRDITTTRDDNTISAYLDANVKFYVHKSDGTTELAVDIDGEDMYTNLTALIDGEALVGNITDVFVGKVQQNSCTYGQIPLTDERKFFNKVVYRFLPSVNDYLNSKELIFSTELFGMFTLSDLVIKYYD